MFWGLVLKANRKYTQKIKKGFHVSQAALDAASCSDEPVQVVLTSENHNYIICTLKKNRVEQVPLDLNFAEGDEISFTSQGNGNVHLSGYLIPEPEDDFDFPEEEESEDEQVEDVQPTKKQKKEKLNKSNASAKKPIKEEEDDDSSEDDSILDSDEEGEDDIGAEEDDDDEDEEEQDESSSEEEEEIAEPKPKQIKLDNKQNGLENGKIQQKEKQKKGKKDKKQQNQKQPQQQEDKSPKGGEKALQGGVKVEDIRVGNGPEAKPGKKVHVYYEGRLKSNNKVFDSSKAPGPGFKFGLCRGEVIKAWDVGVVGMKVGGKRKIICPPNMAYGAKGSPPVIPPNSTLVFEVELKGVN